MTPNPYPIFLLNAWGWVAFHFVDDLMDVL